MNTRYSIAKLSRGLKERSVVVSFVVIASTLLILLHAFSLRITSAVRSYVNGESLYAKGQKDGMHYLLMYADTHNEHYWLQFASSLQVPIGDSLARKAITENKPDHEILEGFLQGGNHPDDVENMVWLFRNFRTVSFMEEAIQLWKEADVQVGEMHQLGIDVHRRIGVNDFPASEIPVLRTRIEKLNVELHKKEKEFSAVMGIGARRIERWLLYGDILFTLLIVGSVGYYSSAMIQRLSAANHKLKWTLDFGGLTSGMFDLKRMELTLNPELLNLLDVNPMAFTKISVESFLKQFVREEDHAAIRNELKSRQQLNKYSHEFEVEFHVHTVKKQNKVLRLKALASGNQAFAVIHDITSLRKLELDSLALKLKEKEDERKRVSDLIEGQELERARLSREMHDGLGQLLNGIQFNLECLTEANLPKVKAKVVGLINDTLTESKRISSNLLPLKLMDFDLSTCISSLCEQASSDRIRVIFQTQPFHDDFNGQQRLTLYRIIQEGIQNAVKHSDCSRVFVQMYCDEHALRISIEDDGSGFNKDMALHNSYGLRNIRYRTESLNGKFEIESSAEYGTLLSISIPNCKEV
ncbi:ATP-binding protein [Chryseolinea sp. T2]|uniref:sensor histidine kinase n=1 Tax=Chryseolinea sp. T2 TaxID=3129255 RepID=UPI003077CD7F